jgi:hypothetical protein
MHWNTGAGKESASALELEMARKNRAAILAVIPTSARAGVFDMVQHPLIDRRRRHQYGFHRVPLSITDRESFFYNRKRRRKKRSPWRNRSINEHRLL